MFGVSHYILESPLVSCTMEVSVSSSLNSSRKGENLSSFEENASFGSHYLSVDEGFAPDKAAEEDTTPRKQEEEACPREKSPLRQACSSDEAYFQASGHLGDDVIPLFRRELTPNFFAQFISSRGNEYFCEIDEEYLTDRFNLTGLNTEVPYYQYALDLITDVFDLDADDELREQIEKSARHLYGLIHARYVVTTRGLAKMVSNAR